MSDFAPVRAFYAAVARADIGGVLATLHSDLEWTEAEGFPYFSGTWTSPNEVVEKLFVPLARDWENFAAKPHDWIAEGDRMVVLGAYSGTARTTGKPMRAEFAHVWSVREGKIVRFKMYADTALVRAALEPGQ